jgi:membrane fusion protein
MLESLFREEAIEFQRRRLWGDVILIRPMSSWLLLGLFSFIVIVGIIFSLTQSYTRRESVRGYLAPSSGLASVSIARAGIVSRVFVHEGQTVRAGERLFEVNTSEMLNSGKSSSTALLARLDEQSAEFRSQMIMTRTKYKNELSQLQNQILGLQARSEVLRQSIRYQKDRVLLSKKDLTESESLIPSGFISGREVSKRKHDYLSELQMQKELAQRLDEVLSQVGLVNIQIKALPLVVSEKNSQILGQLSQLEERRIQANQGSAYSVTAPISGSVSGLQAKVGAAVDGKISLAYIIPKDTLLQAELYIPIRVAGFVASGQQVRVEYDAYPFQQFGMANAVILQVSKSVQNPGEISGPLKFDEPVYHAVAKLDRQTIGAYGQSVMLKSGMLLHGQVVVRQQKLLDWIFEPLRSLQP